ncbi:MAG: hypothetical protein HY667_05085 [Chloroflexi bacterium]|nr:hypothetical protein [Chloroflexota bacterium]
MTPNKSPEELYEERERRVREAIQLKEPDRVPVVLGMAYFPARYTGIQTAAAYYDAATWKEANKKTILDFEPDLYRASSGQNSGRAFEALDTKMYQWPGFNLPPTSGHQYVESEYMKEDEYDLFLSDHADFLIRKYLPRVFGELEPLSRLPPLRTLHGVGLVNMVTQFIRPEFQKAAQAMYKAGQEAEKWRKIRGAFEEEMAALGFPPHGGGGGAGGAPFDEISDYFRGMRGAMIDMYRRPEKLLAACDMLLQMRIKAAVPADPKKRGNPKRLFLALHRGAEGFMSKKQFETFYWPGLKKAVQASVDLGYAPMPFFEGKFGDRIEYLLEFPKGKVVCHFEQTDMDRAKEVLGGHCCIMGNVPSSLLQTASAQEVDEYCAHLIKVCGKGGGFILTNGSSIDDSKPENVKAFVDSVRKHHP